MSCWMKTLHQSLDIQVCDCILLIKNQNMLWWKPKSSKLLLPICRKILSGMGSSQKKLTYSAVVWYVAFFPCSVAFFGASRQEIGCKTLGLTQLFCWQFHIIVADYIMCWNPVFNYVHTPNILQFVAKWGENLLNNRNKILSCCKKIVTADSSRKTAVRFSEILQICHMNCYKHHLLIWNFN